MLTATTVLVVWLGFALGWDLPAYIQKRLWGSECSVNRTAVSCALWHSILKMSFDCADHVLSGQRRGELVPAWPA